MGRRRGDHEGRLAAASSPWSVMSNSSVARGSARFRATSRCSSSRGRRGGMSAPGQRRTYLIADRESVRGDRLRSRCRAPDQRGPRTDVSNDPDESAATERRRDPRRRELRRFNENPPISRSWCGLPHQTERSGAGVAMYLVLFRSGRGAVMSGYIGRETGRARAARHRAGVKLGTDLRQHHGVRSDVEAQELIEATKRLVEPSPIESRTSPDVRARSTTSPAVRGHRRRDRATPTATERCAIGRCHLVVIAPTRARRTRPRGSAGGVA